ncbi:hypothetical protein HDU83_000292 [Entophlyctis luteolus]|nr:hypothetical protein HDU83_000292 [Entophlyctis luteolus]
MAHTTKTTAPSTAGMQFHKLSAHADSYKFQRFLRAFTIKANKDYGYLELMWVPADKRAATAPFSPLNVPRPVESIEDFDARHQLIISRAEATLSIKEAMLYAA